MVLYLEKCLLFKFCPAFGIFPYLYRANQEIDHTVRTKWSSGRTGSTRIETREYSYGNTAVYDHSYYSEWGIYQRK